SELGAGSQFDFSVAMALDAANATPPELALGLTGLRVLLVDDNVVNRTVISRTLESLGMLPSAVASGAQALDWVQRHATSANGIDLVLLDAHMPEMDGFTTAEKILATPYGADLTLVMLSSAGLKGDAQRSKEVGFAAYLSKPFTRDELAQVLTRVVNRSPDTQGDLITRHGIRQAQAALSILLVEDHVINQKLAVALIERWGHRVTVAGDGQAALEVLARQSFDLILMDMMMPVMDGLEATALIRAGESGEQHVPIVAMTANAMQGDRERCLQAGMDDYISKPIEMTELQRVLKRFAPELPNAETLDNSTLGLGGQPELHHVQPAFDYVQALAESDQEVVDIVKEVFMAQWPVDLDKMTAALTSGDMSPLLHTAHALKGTLGLFGAKPATQLALELEKMAADAQHALAIDVPALQHKLDALSAQVGQLMLALEDQSPPGQ
ncbi:response regulator, partial [Rhodoferax sp.]|uniref:response regulator n=1 Tax=Rhodoferax sp. TaxID=50421 RepID=UPI002625DD10